MRLWRLCSLGLLMAGLLLGGGAAVASITTTKHNLSSDNPGTYRATAEQRICLMCHTPHNANPAGPLWNHTLSGATYTPYSSSTLNAQPGQPTGASKLCLSCHDGTVAVGSVYNMPGAYEEWLAPGVYRYSGTIVGLEETIASSALLGIDLRDDHPISFLFDSTLASYSGEFFSPSTLDGPSGMGVKLDQNGELQCTSCHEPHSSENPKFLRVAYQDGGGFGSPLCRTCHNKNGWDTSKHRISKAVWNGADTNPWHVEGQNLANDSVNSTPKANACENCHDPHAGGGGERLLKRDGEQRLCLACHGGTGLEGNVSDATDPTFNIERSLNKLYPHPVLDTAYDGRHRPKRGDVTTNYKVREDPDNLAGANRHVKCQDCHNPHAVQPGVSPNPEDDTITDNTSSAASNVLNLVWGVSPSWPSAWSEVYRSAYTEVDDILYQYQLCLKCHSDYAFDTIANGTSNIPDSYAYPGPGIYKLTDQGKEFNPNNPSYHPVTEFAGKNDFKMTVSGTVYDYSSSLLKGFTPNSTMTCADCHSDPDTLAGTGPKGPHGSDNWPILIAPYDETTGQSGTWDTHLCFRCHDKNVYTYAGGTTSEWWRTGYSGSGMMGRKNLHAFHNYRRNAPCMTCHSAVPHGMKRRALLIYGRSPSTDAGADPEPYNAQSRRVPVTGSNGADYGIPSARDVDAVQSGNWSKSYCHSTGVGVGCAMGM